MHKIASIAAAACCLLASDLRAQPYWPEAARVYFIAPADGAVITGKTPVKFGLSGAGVAPAGVDMPGVGHHHLLIDAEAPSGDELNQPLPASAHVRHFGAGQTETLLDLPPGRHKLQLILGDANHIPHDPRSFPKSSRSRSNSQKPRARTDSCGARAGPIRGRLRHFAPAKPANPGNRWRGQALHREQGPATLAQRRS